MPEPLRIAFAGTPDFAVPTLEALILSPHQVVTVLTQPDRRRGRGRQLSPSPVKKIAQQAGIPVLQPTRLKDTSTQKTLRALMVDVMIVVAYGLWVPPAVLTLPKLGCINLHASLLPRHRGAAPIVHALLAGDQATGVSIMAMDEAMDTGPVYRTLACAIEPDTNAVSLTHSLSHLATDALLDLLDAFAADQNPQPKAQASQGVTLAPKVEKGDARIDWSQSAVHIDRHIRAYALWPVAFTPCGDDLLKIHEAHPIADHPRSHATPGTILKCHPEGLDVQTGNGVLRIRQLQRPGSRTMPIKAIWHQPYFKVGAVLG